MLALQTTPTYYDELREYTAREEPRPIFQLDTQDSEGYTPAVRRGRPSHLAKAGQAANQTRIYVESRKRPRPESSPDTTVIGLSSQIPSTLTSQGYYQVLGTQEQAPEKTTQEITSDSETTQLCTSQIDAE